MAFGREKAERFELDVTLCEEGGQNNVQCPIYDDAGMVSGISGGEHTVEASTRKGQTTLVVRNSMNTLAASDSIKLPGEVNEAEVTISFANCVGCIDGKCSALTALAEIAQSRNAQ